VRIAAIEELSTPLFHHRDIIREADIYAEDEKN
jgi:hypothetical protein